MQPAIKPYGVYVVYVHNCARFNAKPKSADSSADPTTIQIMSSVQHKLDLAQFLRENHIGVMLLSETHITNKYNFQLRLVLRN